MTKPTILFRETMARRRRFKRGTLDHDALTRAARKYWWIVTGRPSATWPKD